MSVCLYSLAPPALRCILEKQHADSPLCPLVHFEWVLTISQVKVEEFWDPKCQGSRSGWKEAQMIHWKLASREVLNDHKGLTGF